MSVEQTARLMLERYGANAVAIAHRWGRRSRQGGLWHAVQRELERMADPEAGRLDAVS